MIGLPSSLLFACSENSVRSPMAEALAKRLYGQRVYIDSVGVRASEVDGFAVAALDEIDIDVHRHHAKTFDDVDAASFELIVTLSPEAHHSALEFTRGTATEVEYWPMPDPSAVEGSRETRLEAYRHTRDQVLARLKSRFGIPITPSV
ncbi:arsenate reductase ArsC [Reyranella sp.]|jgi:protein-tyrosine-phosphatase|uniref:arsenate-mycothiol transferase ArsC n=1 Tax=Reyranella sp. TaxID=1929291 RepID=UPI000BC96715|nr:arsenate reductase ArsC [Reyranella sp.]OYY47108.1 MAG: low molecular weight phosphatase family protein [Rhodospirillales bacterium 35-66-84]OYZ97128.1 MAG: low molecular weight phosphatase family protein [Rhodospirillales bacterium 24-66-33]OZB27545.1 MAG: low molecular weight phosphatase family protein [Rhodospirillales bacterium 39-66-50]HQS14046.1 arsenate reductase ArsC [Reyranella sp.]HQT10531.1 arsenate reductase ArsC [Reyranella sp.]